MNREQLTLVLALFLAIFLFSIGVRVGSTVVLNDLSLTMDEVVEARKQCLSNCKAVIIYLPKAGE